MPNQPIPWFRRRDIVIAYTFLRIVLGVNFFNVVAEVLTFSDSKVRMDSGKSEVRRFPNCPDRQTFVVQ
ncbi:MAG: hypothetical protein RIM23_18510 [Coleofasciculus sp. G3-WIS-01]